MQGIRTGERVRTVRNLLGLSQHELAELSDFSQSHISQVENGVKPATPEFLEVIAERTGSPRAFFDVITPDLPPDSLRFRRNASSSRTEAKRAATLLTEAYRVVSQLLGHLDVPPPVLPRVVGDVDVEEIEELAAQVREALSIGHDGPIMHVTRACERAGIAVVPLALPRMNDDEYETVGHFGASCWPSPEEHALVGFFATASGDRQRFTIAHELGHLVLHARRRQVADPEGEANRFAAAFLLPRNRVIEIMEGESLTLRDYARLKATWGISIQALIMRGSQVGFIDENRRSSLFRQISARGWRKQEPVKVMPEEPRLVWKAIRALCGAESTYSKAAEQLGLHAMILRGLAPMGKDGGVDPARPRGAANKAPQTESRPRKVIHRFPQGGDAAET